MQSAKGQVDSLVKENKGLKSKVKNDELEQYIQKFNLVIHRIPEHTEEEDNVAYVVTLGILLQVNLTPGCIDILHRMNTKSKDKPRPIIARFSN